MKKKFSPFYCSLIRNKYKVNVRFSLKILPTVLPSPFKNITQVKIKPIEVSDFELTLYVVRLKHHKSLDFSHGMIPRRRNKDRKAMSHLLTVSSLSNSPIWDMPKLGKACGGREESSENQISNVTKSALILALTKPKLSVLRSTD